MKKYILFFLVLSVISCADRRERKIERHFNKFILKDDFKDYKIDKIKQFVISQNIIETDKVNHKIIESSEKIGNLSFMIVKAKNELDVIKTGKERNLNGVTYFSDKPMSYEILHYGIASDGFKDNNNKRQEVIDQKLKFIENKYGELLEEEEYTKTLQRKIDSLKNDKNVKPAYYKSTVTIKGETASGIDKRDFYVWQYPNGDIKLLQ